LKVLHVVKTRNSAALLALLLLAAGCGGGGSNGGGGVIPDPACLEFNASNSPASGEVAAREAVGSTCDRIVVELIITDVNDIFGFQIDFTYDDSVVSYDGFSTSGSILVNDGATLLVVTDPDPATVPFSISAARPGAASGSVDATGQHRLIRVFFRRLVESGTSSLAFTEGRLFNVDPPPDNEIPGIPFHGGTFVVR
jgi:hypothetical protein